MNGQKSSTLSPRGRRILQLKRVRSGYPFTLNGGAFLRLTLEINAIARSAG